MKIFHPYQRTKKEEHFKKKRKRNKIINWYFFETGIHKTRLRQIIKFVKEPTFSVIIETNQKKEVANMLSNLNSKHYLIHVFRIRESKAKL